MELFIPPMMVRSRRRGWCANVVTFVTEILWVRDWVYGQQEGTLLTPTSMSPGVWRILFIVYTFRYTKGIYQGNTPQTELITGVEIAMSEIRTIGEGSQFQAIRIRATCRQPHRSFLMVCIY